MKRILRLDWDKCPAGYVGYDQHATHDGPKYDGTLFEELRTHAGGAFVAARSALREAYRVEGNGGKYRVEGIDEKDLVCLALANTPRTPDGVMQFANSWGLLYGHNEERIADAYELIDHLNKAIRDLHDVGSANFLRCLNPKARAGLKEHWVNGKVYGQATCLAAFCRHQLMELAEAEREIRRCDYCDKLYASRIRTGNRREGQEPRFCLVGRCRKAYHSKGLDELMAPGGIKATRSPARTAG